MFSTVWDFVFKADFTNFAGALLYWLPLLMTFIFVCIELSHRYMQDIEYRDKAKALNDQLRSELAENIELITEEKSRQFKRNQSTYIPTVTIGDIVKGILISITPVVNLFYSIFKVIPDNLSCLIKILNIPLVSKQDETFRI